MLSLKVVIKEIFENLGRCSNCLYDSNKSSVFNSVIKFQVNY